MQTLVRGINTFLGAGKPCEAEGQAWCSGESCLTELPGRGFEAASPQILRGGRLASFFPSPDPTHVGASGTGSALFY